MSKIDGRRVLEVAEAASQRLPARRSTPPTYSPVIDRGIGWRTSCEAGYDA